MIHLKLIFRSWWRNKLNTAISVISLTIGLACSIILTFFVIEEYKIPHKLGDCSNVFIIESVNSFYAEKNVRESSSSANTGMSFAHKFPEVESWITVNDLGNRLRFKDMKNLRGMDKGLFGVTPSFCDMVTLPVIEGDLRRTINAGNEIAVTNDFMRRIFGRDAVLGDVLEAESGGEWINGAEVPKQMKRFTITTILDENEKLPLKYGALVQTSVASIKEANGVTLNHHFSFIKLGSNVNVNEFKEKFAKDSAMNADYSLVPFVDSYFDSENRDKKRGDEMLFARRDKMLLIIALSISFAVLLIAIFNYINITMTRAKSRLKNIAGQIIFGASKSSVRMQTILDTTMMVAISFGFALMIIHSVLPQFNAFMDSNIRFHMIMEGTNWLVILLLCLAVVLFASLYILTKIEVSSPMETFKNPLGKRNTVSQVMIVAQFAVSVALIIFGLNISRQIYYIVNSRVDASNIITVSIRDRMPQDFVDAVTSLAFVSACSPHSSLPRMSISNNDVAINAIMGNEQMTEFYEMEFVEGRNFTPGDENSAIVNESFLKNMNINESIGHEFEFNGKKLRIAGVVRDFVYEDTRKNIQSLAIIYDKYAGYKYYMNIKVTGDAQSREMELRELWKKMYPKQDGDFTIKSLAQQYREMHPQEQRLMTIVNIFMALSIVLTALGLFGLAFYTVGQRSKEIALRKIHGSTTMSVIMRLCRTFAIWVGIAFVVAVPVAYYFSAEWLSGFVYRVPMAWWVFALTAVVAAAVTFITVIFQSWNAASANPAESIKSE